MPLEIILFLVASVVGCIPSIFNMKTEKENAKGWKSLNKWGKAYVIFFASLLILGLYTIVSNKIEKNANERRLIEKNKRDSLSHKEEGLRDSISNASLTYKVTKLDSSFNSYKLAIKKSGYVYDSINGRIIQIGDRNSNQGTNFGNIGGKNNRVYNNFNRGQRLITEEGLKEMVKLIPSKETIITIASMGDTESLIFGGSIIKGLKSMGYYEIETAVSVGVIIPEFSFGLVKNRFVIKIPQQ